MNHFNPVHISHTYFHKIHFNTSLLSTSWPISKKLSNQIFPTPSPLQVFPITTTYNNTNYYPVLPKTLTALIPESCCESCITTPMMRGDLSVGEHISSIMDMVASACCARSSARISSMSSSTWFDARSLRNAEIQRTYDAACQTLTLPKHAALKRHCRAIYQHSSQYMQLLLRLKSPIDALCNQLIDSECHIHICTAFIAVT